MSRTLTISDDLYSRLEAEARVRGLNSVERLLEEWESSPLDLRRRREAVRRIDRLRERLTAEHGQLPDSTESLREDRAR